MTAVEWLAAQMLNIPKEHLGYYINKFKQAKEMEKHGLKEAFKQGVIECGFENSAEDWANEWIDKATTL